MKIILVRHGETDMNLQGIVMGHRAVPINESGRHQAVRVAKQLKGERITAIYSSDIRRAKETAEIIAKALHLRITLSIDLRERYYGKQFDFRLSDDIKEEIENMGLAVHEYRPPGGENMDDVQVRCARFLKRLERKKQQGTILIVSHGTWIKAFASLVLGRSFKSMDHVKSKNTAVAMLQNKQGRWLMHGLLDASHLD